ncbi:MAG TPA: hypothetical protein VEZ11_00405, partial [Thermoanaerobaculia bacterium]|nr:hypothetical protein [Thermoanaerobaculia bacterium]
MRRMRLLVWLLGFFVTSHATAQVHHYIFFGLERKGIAAESFLDSGAEGAQLKYTWRELEPEEGHYDFSAIRADLAILRAHGKKLFLQIQDVSFDPRIVNVPKYLLSDPEYHGGIALQYEYDGKHEDKARPAGVVARRWDPAVQRRFQFLLYALGKEFDGLVEGV